jgi:alcohol dehydrogenase
MDALTQLMEAFVSLRSNPFTDALALSGVKQVCGSLLAWYEGGGAASAARSGMAYAALMSGITLAQAGLGAVHGLASPLGAYYPVPHGVVCGTLLASSTRVNIQALRRRAPGHPALAKYRVLGRVLSGKPQLEEEAAEEALVEALTSWTRRLGLPPLSRFGIGEADLDVVVANCRAGSMKTNPLILLDEELREILSSRL